MAVKLVQLGILGVLMISGVFGDGLMINQKEAPESLDDLRLIQSSLQDGLEQARAATVCLQVGEGSGSAVIVNSEGLVLSAAHVTTGVEKEVRVLMEDGREFSARSLGLHSETDAAMLQILDEGPFPFVEIDKQDRSEVGDWVYSLGHSGGFDEDRGVNVRLGRLVRSSESTIQSDTMLIGGDSGGPLFDLAGRLIGIHSRVGASREESLHVPIREFQKNWEKLQGGEFLGEGPFAARPEPGSGFLGISVKEIEGSGLAVDEVWEGSIAEESGLAKGDLILEVDGKAATEESLSARLGELAVDEMIRLKWSREGEMTEMELKLGARP